MKAPDRYPVDEARFNERAVVRDLSNSTFCARHARSGKWWLQKRERAFFCRRHSTQKQKGKWCNSIRISALVARRTPAGKNAAARSRRGTKGKQGTPYEVSLAHWIAIKYLYHYLHFKSALARPCSSFLARYRRPYAARGFFVVDYKSPFSLLSVFRAHAAGNLRGRIEKTREYL